MVDLVMPKPFLYKKHQDDICCQLPEELLRAIIRERVEAKTKMPKEPIVSKLFDQLKTVLSNNELDKSLEIYQKTIYETIYMYDCSVKDALAQFI